MKPCYTVKILLFYVSASQYCYKFTLLHSKNFFPNSMNVVMMLSVHAALHYLLYLSIFMFIKLIIYPLSLPLSLSFSLSVSPSLSLSFSLSLPLPPSLSFFLSLPLSLSLLISLPVFVSVSLYSSLSFSLYFDFWLYCSVPPSPSSFPSSTSPSVVLYLSVCRSIYLHLHQIFFSLLLFYSFIFMPIKSFIFPQ